jgi:hypothetical protein
VKRGEGVAEGVECRPRSADLLHQRLQVALPQTVGIDDPAVAIGEDERGRVLLPARVEVRPHLLGQRRREALIVGLGMVLSFRWE